MNRDRKSEKLIHMDRAPSCSLSLWQRAGVRVLQHQSRSLLPVRRQLSGWRSVSGLTATVVFVV